MVRIKSLGLPESKKDKAAPSGLADEIPGASTSQDATDAQGDDTTELAGQSNVTVKPLVSEEHESEAAAAAGEDSEVTWDDTFESSLLPFLSASSIAELKKMYLEGPEPPRISDSGWVGRAQQKPEDLETPEQDIPSHQDNGPQPQDASGERNKTSWRERQTKRPWWSFTRLRTGRPSEGPQRGVLSSVTVLSFLTQKVQPMGSKATRGTLHQMVRKLFKGKLESETDMSTPAGEEGSRITIMWSG